MRILLVDDKKKITTVLKAYLITVQSKVEHETEFIIRLPKTIKVVT